MSDLYLDLKRRIPVVTEWTNVGSEEMQRAQDRMGLSDERLARLVPVSAKTWVRWKRRGQIPTHLLPKVAPLLGFELVEPTLTPLSVGAVSEEGLQDAMATVLALLRSIDSHLVRIEQAMPAQVRPRMTGARQRN